MNTIHLATIIHYTTTDDEIVELGELFYASSGAGSVEIDRFVEALDAAGNGTSTLASDLGLKGKFKTHPLGIGTCASEYMYAKTHGKWTEEELDVKLTHVPPEKFVDKAAFVAVKAFRFGFDIGTYHYSHLLLFQYYKFAHQHFSFRHWLEPRCNYN